MYTITMSRGFWNYFGILLYFLKCMGIFWNLAIKKEVLEKLWKSMFRTISLVKIRHTLSAQG